MARDASTGIFGRCHAIFLFETTREIPRISISALIGHIRYVRLYATLRTAKHTGGLPHTGVDEQLGGRNADERTQLTVQAAAARSGKNSHIVDVGLTVADILLYV